MAVLEFSWYRIYSKKKGITKGNTVEENLASSIKHYYGASSYEYYEKQISQNRISSWNFAAFFYGILWLLSRRLFKHSIIFISLHCVLHAAYTLASYYLAPWKVAITIIYGAIIIASHCVIAFRANHWSIHHFKSNSDKSNNNFLSRIIFFIFAFIFTAGTVAAIQIVTKQYTNIFTYSIISPIAPISNYVQTDADTVYVACIASNNNELVPTIIKLNYDTPIETNSFSIEDNSNIKWESLKVHHDKDNIYLSFSELSSLQHLVTYNHNLNFITSVTLKADETIVFSEASTTPAQSTNIQDVIKVNNFIYDISETTIMDKLYLTVRKYSLDMKLIKEQIFTHLEVKGFKPTAIRLKDSIYIISSNFFYLNVIRVDEDLKSIPFTGE